jgi:hypothetical protein
VRRVGLLLALAAAAVTALAPPAGATVHEIVAQWCSGQGPLEPKGISDPAKSNFARPLIASGVATIVAGPAPDTILVQFNFDHPAIKVVPTGNIVPLFPGAPIFITQWTTDDDFAAFRNCPGYVSHTEP